MRGDPSLMTHKCMSCDRPFRGVPVDELPSSAVPIPRGGPARGAIAVDKAAHGRIVSPVRASQAKLMRASGSTASTTALRDGCAAAAVAAA